MAEQNFNQATKIADRGYIIVHGKIEFEGAAPASSARTSWSRSTPSACRPPNAPVARWPVANAGAW
jgi:hypothetical protein